jgi:hypothetical protein
VRPDLEWQDLNYYVVSLGYLGDPAQLLANNG